MKRSPEELSANELQKRLDNLSEKISHINQILIDAGRGYEKIQDTLQKQDKIAIAYQKVYKEYGVLLDEKSRRIEYSGTLAKIKRKESNYAI